MGLQQRCASSIKPKEKRAGGRELSLNKKSRTQTRARFRLGIHWPKSPPGSQKGPPTSSQPSELAPPPVLPRGVCGLDAAGRTRPGRVVPRTCSPGVCVHDDGRRVPTVPCWSEGTWGPSHKRHPAKAQLGLWQAVGRSRPPALSPVPTASSGAIQPTAGRTAASVRWFME